jgi:hypothetical protein
MFKPLLRFLKRKAARAQRIWGFWIKNGDALSHLHTLLRQFGFYVFAYLLLAVTGDVEPEGFFLRV